MRSLIAGSRSDRSRSANEAALSIGVVIPTRNRAKALERALASVEAQTLPPHDILVVDDASDPSQWEEVRELASETVTILRSDERILGSAARNRGWRASTSDLIAFLDDDDIWLPDKLEHQAALFQSSDVDFSWTAYRVLDPEDRRLPTEVYPRDGSFRKLLQDSDLVCPSLMVRRAVLEAIGGFDESLPRNQDRDLFLRLSKDFRGKYLDVPLTVIYQNIPSAQACIDGQRIFLQKWMPFIDQLSSADQRKVFARHHSLLWSNYALMGNLGEERRHLLEILRHDPFNLRYLQTALLTILHHLGWKGQFFGRSGE